MVKNIKLNATHKNMFPAHLVAHKAEAEVPVLMILGFIIKNATVRIIMNGVPRKRNAFVQLLSNILAPAQAIQEEMEILVIINMQNANVQADMFGMPQPVHVFVQVLTNIHVQARDMPEEREQLVMANIHNVNAQAVMFGILRKELVSVMV